MQTIQFENAVEQSTGGNQAVPTINYFVNAYAKSRAKTINWHEFVGMVQNPTIWNKKELAAGLAPFSSAQRELPDAEQSLFSVLVGDLDNVPYAIPRLVDKIRLHGHTGTLAIYTTYRHQREGNSNRYRVVIPLAEPVDAQTYKTLVTGLNQILGEGADRCAESINQLFFAPTKAERSSPYEYHIQDGGYLSANIGFCELLRFKAVEAEKTTGLIRKEENPKCPIDTQIHRYTDTQDIPPQLKPINIESLPANCKPKAVGQRNLSLFYFAKFLMSEYEGIEAGDLLPFVEQWYEYFLPVIGTKDWETTWSDFTDGFKKVKFKYGEGIESLLPTLGDLVLPLPVQAHITRMRYQEGTERLIKLCFALAGNSDSRMFYLSYRDAAKAMDCDCHKTAGRRLSALAADKLIKVVKAGTAGERGKATTYQLLADEEGNF